MPLMECNIYNSFYSMLDVIAKDKGTKLYRTLTGFKYIGEKLDSLKLKNLMELSCLIWRIYWIFSREHM